ncbi:hypothetical protein BDP27DRAFT_1245786, partial [Rhodocollybia butyracea]
YDHKRIGERHQRHCCRRVCYKGCKNDGICRFGYPHKVVEHSHFDTDSNSIILARLESDAKSFQRDFTLLYSLPVYNLLTIYLSQGKPDDTAVSTVEEVIFRIFLRKNYPPAILQALFAIPMKYVDSQPMTAAERKNLILSETCREARILYLVPIQE